VHAVARGWLHIIWQKRQHHLQLAHPCVSPFRSMMQTRHPFVLSKGYYEPDIGGWEVDPACGLYSRLFSAKAVPISGEQNPLALQKRLYR
jgi:hypothetical protein